MCCAHQILQALLRPSVAKFIELATMTEGLDLIIEECLVSHDSPLAGKKLRDANIRRELNVILIAVVRDGGEMIFNPTADTVVSGGDRIIAIGPKAAVDGLARVSHGQPARAT